MIAHAIILFFFWSSQSILGLENGQQHVVCTDSKLSLLFQFLFRCLFPFRVWLDLNVPPGLSSVLTMIMLYVL